MAELPITFACPACCIKLTVPGNLAGVTGPCPSCRAQIQAPSPAPAPIQVSAHASHTPPGNPHTGSLLRRGLWLGAFLLIAGALVYGIRDILMNQERPSPVAAVTAHQPPAPPPIPPQPGDAPEKSIGTRDNQGRPLPVPEPDHLGGGILQ